MTVRNRDAGQCMRCNLSESEVRLSVHHLVPDTRVPEDFDAHLPVNLISLCQKCHGKMESMGISTQLREIGVNDREELILSDTERKALNRRLSNIEPEILNVKPVGKEESREFINADFGGLVTDQPELSDFSQE